MLAFQSQFEARSDDVVLTSFTKTGTTWLKDLAASIMIRSQDQDQDQDELAVKNPHSVTSNIEQDLGTRKLRPDDLSGMPSPRLLHTHLPSSALPDSIKKSDCKMVYITRNPKDTLVSSWHFLNKVLRRNQEPYPFEKAFDDFCKGYHYYGPYFDHVLQYWSESLKVPNRLLFLKYEDLKRDPKGEVKRLAAFLGRPFESEDEVDKVLQRSSLERLKNLPVNKNNAYNSTLFRLGVVGDWKNYLTPEMEQRLDEITSTNYRALVWIFRHRNFTALNKAS